MASWVPQEERLRYSLGGVLRFSTCEGKRTQELEAHLSWPALGQTTGFSTPASINHWIWTTWEGHSLGGGGFPQLRQVLSGLEADNCLLRTFPELRQVLVERTLGSVSPHPSHCACILVHPSSPCSFCCTTLVRAGRETAILHGLLGWGRAGIA